jgi:hypothetical protein
MSKVVAWGNCYWFPNYAVEDPVKTLREKLCVVFTHGVLASDVVADCELCQRHGCPTCNGTGVILFDYAHEEGGTT